MQMTLAFSKVYLRLHVALDYRNRDMPIIQADTDSHQNTNDSRQIIIAMKAKNERREKGE
jgi:hypothetical protein